MTHTDIFSLFIGILIMAVIPGPAVFAVIARSLSSGFIASVYMILGFLAADFIFIALAITGLTAISALMGAAFIVIQYASAVYLIYLGGQLFRRDKSTENPHYPPESHLQLIQHFLEGFILTLANPKAIMFYVGFFPAFIDLNSIVLTDVLIVIGLVTITIAGVNLGYALLAIKSKGQFTSQRDGKIIKRIAGSALILTGIFVAVRDL